MVLRHDGFKIYKWSVDAAFVVHPNFKSHFGGVMAMASIGGGMASGSTKKTLNTCSSTEAEIVSADDFL